MFLYRLMTKIDELAGKILLAACYYYGMRQPRTGFALEKYDKSTRNSPSR
jgi:hypothetical protein